MGTYGCSCGSRRRRSDFETCQPDGAVMNRVHIAACGLLLASAFGARSDDQPKAGAPLAPPAVRSVAFSPDGKVLVAAAGKKDQPGALVAWDADTLKPLWRRTAPAAFGSVSFSPDGKSIAV